MLWNVFTTGVHVPAVLRNVFMTGVHVPALRLYIPPVYVSSKHCQPAARTSQYSHGGSNSVQPIDLFTFCLLALDYFFPF